MVSLLLKGILFYIGIAFIRSIWRGYKMVDGMKRNAGSNYNSHSGGDSRGQQRGQQTSPQGDIIEAEFRVLDKDKDKNQK